MNYLETIQDRYKDMLFVVEAQQGLEPYTQEDLEYQARIATLGDILGIVTYDYEQAARLVKIAIETIDAITERTTFKYIEKVDAQYENYLTAVNLAFFKGKLEWGTSIRGAWWDGDNLRDGCIIENGVSREEWEKFMRALVVFAKGAYK